MKDPGNILQIVPRPPGGRDGVGDYARTLAVGLQKIHGRNTTFISAARSAAAQTQEGFDVLSPLAAIPDEECPTPAKTSIVLHYVNYGYDRRGVPVWLPRKLRRLQKSCGGQFLTVFHELYASGTWRQSAFWLRPVQMLISRAIARLSNGCIVSSEVLREQLQRLAPSAPIFVRPVFSNFGEPVLDFDQIAGRDPHRWVICGGTELIERSVRSFFRRRSSLGEAFAPRELFVLGGADRSVIRKILEVDREVVGHYLPDVDVASASRILASCAFGWIDYFERQDVPTAAILKSTAFAAYCAHGVIPVFPHPGSRMALGQDALPGPFFAAGATINLPSETERPNVAQTIYAWYSRNASSVHLAECIAQTLGK